MISEREVRTRAGWIGVEISKSRVRRTDDARFGRYRVRGSTVIARAVPALGPDMKSRELTEWTPYAFTLDEIDRQIDNAIHGGTAGRPDWLMLVGDDGQVTNVPTRWTSAYRGARDLGVVPVAVRPEYAAEVGALAALVDAGLIEMRHEAGCSCAQPDRFEARCARLTISGEETVSRRRRRGNAEFQAEHKARREAGLRARHAAKLSRREPGA